MRGVRNSNNVIRIPLMAFLYRTLGPTRFVKGCNMAFWRNDLIRVNGYDESFCGWGREDSELAIRLDNSGIRQRCMKFRGVVFHLTTANASATASRPTRNVTSKPSVNTAPAAKPGLHAAWQQRNRPASPKPR